MIIITDKFTKKKVMPKTRPHGPKFDTWYLKFLSQCKRDVVNETRDENMQNVIEKQLQSKETRDENEAAQSRFCFFCYFYSFVCFILVLHEKRLLENIEYK